MRLLSVTLAFLALAALVACQTGTSLRGATVHGDVSIYNTSPQSRGSNAITPDIKLPLVPGGAL